MKPIALFVCLLLSPAFRISAAELFPVHRLPRMTDVQIDGDLSEWNETAFRIDVLYPKAAVLPEDGDFGATAWMAWDGEGVLLGVRIRDDHFVESPASQPWSSDSIEIFLAGGAELRQQGQIVLVPGLDPDSGAGGKPTHNVMDRRAGRELPIEPVYQVLPAEDGYTMEMRIPAAAFGIQLQSGETFSLDLQFNDRDRREGGERREWTWFTTGWPGNGPEFMHSLELADKASGPADAAAGSSLSPDFRSQHVFVIASPGRDGNRVEVVQGGVPVLSAELRPGNRHTAVTMELPLPDASDAEPFEVRFDGRLLHRFDTAGVPEKRMEAVRDAAWEFASVFYSDVFPRPDFEVPGWIYTLTGGYTLDTTYYDAAYREVDSADSPGRYGAVTVLTADGMPPMRFYHTLYRARGTEEDTQRWEELSLRVEQLPASLGVPPELLERQAGPVSRFLRWDARRLLSRRENGARLLAALEENGDGMMHVGTDPWSGDQAWWLGLKKQLGLFRHRYYVDLPEGYDDPARRGETWPLILFLHGSGERGDDENPVPKHGPSRLIREGAVLPFIVISPQCEKDEWWTAPRVMDLLEELKADYRFDEDRMYLTGLSMGGYGSWETAQAYPDIFAAVAPICGGGTEAEASRIVNLPVWNFHGDADTVVPFRKSVAMVEAVRAAGGQSVAFTVYPGVGHNAWTATYDNPDLYTWFLSNRRGQPPVLPEQIKDAD